LSLFEKYEGERVLCFNLHSYLMKRFFVPLLLLVAAADLQATTYKVDDDTGESGFGGFGETFYWVNGFTSQAGAENIHQVQISFGASGATPSTYNGKAIHIAIWSDPNDDGNPDDAVLEGHTTGVISGFVNTIDTTATAFANFDFSSGVTIPAGEKFFVGFGYYLSGNSVFGAARDSSSSGQGNSWAMRWNFDNPDAYAEMSTATTKQNFDTVFGGNAMIRAIGQSPPTPYVAWAGAAVFHDDDNADGVSNGLAWLLGAGAPAEDARGLLPSVTENSGNLVFSFSMRNAVNRGDALLYVQHSSDLGVSDAWNSSQALVPDTSGTVNGVSFTVSGAGNMNNVTATIPSSEAVNGNLFGRLVGSEN
jgi:hypothetical protein